MYRCHSHAGLHRLGKAIARAVCASVQPRAHSGTAAMAVCPTARRRGHAWSAVAYRDRHGRADEPPIPTMVTHVHSYGGDDECASAAVASAHSGSTHAARKVGRARAEAHSPMLERGSSPSLAERLHLEPKPAHSRVLKRRPDRLLAPLASACPTAHSKRTASRAEPSRAEPSRGEPRLHSQCYAPSAL